LFDHHKFDEWVERGEAAAIPSSLKLYNEVRELGFKTFLLTGRSEGHRGVTVDNLNKQGFHDWEKLVLRYIPKHITTSHYHAGDVTFPTSQGSR
jgi:predicted secreted acid phosphatase